MTENKKYFYKFFQAQPDHREHTVLSGSQTECDLLSVILMAKPLSPPLVRVNLAAADFFRPHPKTKLGECVC